MKCKDGVIMNGSLSLPLCGLLYKTAVPLFRHDHLTATKFGRHMRIDLGIIRILKKLTHPTPGVTNSKVRKQHELPRKSIKHVYSHPTNPTWGWES